MDKNIVVVFVLSIVITVNASPPEFPANHTLEVGKLLLYYANCGLTYAVISVILQEYHSLALSANAIRKRLKRCGYPCRRGPTAVTDDELKSAIREKLKLLPRTVGYRQITDKLKQEGYHIRRDAVMRCLREIDPEGVQFRRRRRIQRRCYRSLGPNHTWHIDGYDKLKPYGFPIHGCIDGYSRKIMWLKVGPSNNDPQQVAHHYMTAVKLNRGCPLIVQADRGTENSIIGALQCVFKSENEYSDNFNGHFKLVPSQLNQRIEAWWSMFRRGTSQWWMDLFRDLVTSGLYEPHIGNAVKCMRYLFIPLLQNELDAIVEQWNNHYLCGSRNGGCPNGRPNVLFSVPVLSGAQECIQNVNDEEIAFGFPQTTEPSITGDAKFDEIADQISFRNGWTTPKSWQEALQIYLSLFEQITLYG